MLFDSITLANGAKVDNLTVVSGIVLPDASAGEFFFKSDENVLFYFDGIKWCEVTEVNVEGSAGLSATSNRLHGVKTVQLTLADNLLAIESLSTTGVVKRNANNAWSAEQVNLATDVTNNLGVSNLASGQNANATTFWRGDGTWQPLAPNLTIMSGASLPLSASTGNLFYLETGLIGLYYYTGSEWVAVGSASSSGSSTETIVSNFVGNLTSNVGVSRYYSKKSITIKSVHFSVGVTPTSGNISIDVKKSGVSIFSTKPTINVGENLSNTIDVNVALTSTDWLTTDIIVEGIGGQHATIIINYI